MNERNLYMTTQLITSIKEVILKQFSISCGNRNMVMLDFMLNIVNCFSDLK